MFYLKFLFKLNFKFRFYFKCTTCHAELSFKTDPKNSDYVVENGG